MPSRPWGSLGLQPRDPPGPGGHYFFTNNALAGILIIIFPRGLALRVTQFLGLALGVTQILALGNAKIYQHVGIYCVR